jgi:hypothetical protein
MGDCHQSRPHIVVPKPAGGRDALRSKICSGLAPLQPIPPSLANDPDDPPAEEAGQCALLPEGKGERDAAEPSDAEWSEEEPAPTPAPILRLARRPAVRRPT